MNTGTKRVHLIVPDDLLRDVDLLVGPRRRSEFFVTAAREKVARERLRAVAHVLAGSLKRSLTPGWETPEEASARVRSLRAESDKGAFSFPWQMLQSWPFEKRRNASPR